MLSGNTEQYLIEDNIREILFLYQIGFSFLFGITSNRTYTLRSEAYSDFRNNYCGTCKTIRKIYGNKERLFLNHDVVFLSELLSEIENEKKNFSEITIYKCLDLPKDESNIPAFLKYSAAVNILLAYYKINDNAADSKYRLNIWDPLKFLEKQKFRKARRALIDYGVDVELIDDNINEQFKKELSCVSFQTNQKYFQHYANATRSITGEVFKSSVSTIGRNELRNLFYTIGESFGEIVYLLDALLDYKNDQKHNKFNDCP